jgi:hypothetical protein
MEFKLLICIAFSGISYSGRTICVLKENMGTMIGHSSGRRIGGIHTINK